MAKRINRKFDLTPAQSKYILQRLIDERRVSSADLGRYMRRMESEIEELEHRLQSLRPARATPAHRPAPSTSTRPAPRRRSAATGALLASRQLQAEYIRTIKTFPRQARAKYSEITKKSGREAALAAMKKDMGAPPKHGRPRRRRARSKK